MSDTPPPESAFSGMDLAKSFLPDWAKDASPSRIVERYARGGGEEGPRRGGDRETRRGGGDRHPDGRGPQDRRPRDGRRERDGRGQRDGRRDPREERSEAPPAPLGWSAAVVPDPRGVDGLAKQIKSSGKAYPIFDLALLILEKPERYRVEFRRDSGQAAALFQLSLDGSLWTAEKEAVRHALARHFDKFYRRERVSVDPPKGSFPCVAVCGDIVLGPPNHHEYQTRLREVHAARFRNLPFDAFKSRIQMVRDPEFIEKWKQEQSSKDEFYPLDSPEGTEGLKFSDMASVERHFLATHAGMLIAAAESPVEIPGSSAGSPVVRQLVSHAVSDLRRFPLPLAHILGQSFNSAGLQIFKAHENITYVGVARPRYLDRTVSPVAEGLAGILDYLESHPAAPRPEQWKALLALRTTGPADQGTASLASDLFWLIHQGHVMDYAKHGLEAVRKPKPPRDAAPKKARTPAKAATPRPPVLQSEDSGSSL